MLGYLFSCRLGASSGSMLVCCVACVVLRLLGLDLLGVISCFGLVGVHVGV